MLPLAVLAVVFVGILHSSVAQVDFAPNECIPFLSWWSPEVPDTETLAGYQLSDFNLISFLDVFASRGGDVQGRLATLNLNFNNVTAGGWSIGDRLLTKGENRTDIPRPYSLVAGGSSFCFDDGSIFPDGTDSPLPGQREGFFFTDYLGLPNGCTPTYLIERQTGFCADAPTQCASGSFSFMYTAITNIMTQLVQLPRTVSISKLFYGKRLTFRDTNVFSNVPNVSALSYKQIFIPNSWWNAAKFVKFDVPNPQDFWTFVWIQNDDCRPTYFRYANFPLPAEKVVFFFESAMSDCGFEPEIVALNSVQGSIIAPDRPFRQPRGVVDTGYIITGTVLDLNQINLPDCAQPSMPPLLSCDACATLDDSISIFSCCNFNEDCTTTFDASSETFICTETSTSEPDRCSVAGGGQDSDDATLLHVPTSFSNLIFTADVDCSNGLSSPNIVVDFCPAVPTTLGDVWFQLDFSGVETESGYVQGPVLNILECNADGGPLDQVVVSLLQDIGGGQFEQINCLLVSCGAPIPIDFGNWKGDTTNLYIRVVFASTVNLEQQQQQNQVLKMQDMAMQTEEFVIFEMTAMAIADCAPCDNVFKPNSNDADQSRDNAAECCANVGRCTYDANVVTCSETLSS